jgi:hypothetical protein
MQSILPALASVGPELPVHRLGKGACQIVRMELETPQLFRLVHSYGAPLVLPALSAYNRHTRHPRKSLQSPHMPHHIPNSHAPAKLENFLATGGHNHHWTRDTPQREQSISRWILSYLSKVLSIFIAILRTRYIFLHAGRIFG